MKETNAFKELQDILNFAIQNEQEAVEFYTDLKKQVSTPEVIKEIEQLIKIEEGHKKTLEGIKVAEYVKSLNQPAINLRISEYVAEVEPRPDMNLAELLNIAMHREKKAMELYQHLSKFFEGEPRRLFQNLAAEESDHKYLFENKWDYHKVKSL